MALIDLTGRRFGRLVVIERLPENYQRQAMWRSVCDCGGEAKSTGYNLRAGHTASCGCLQKERSVAAHTFDLEQRFWSKVNKSDGCWVWTASRHKRGYGLFHQGRTRIASVVSWEIANGTIPSGMLVCHRCDNPPCVRPDHLFLGTVSDNAVDSVQKGRAGLLKASDIPEIRSSAEKCRVLADRFGVHVATIRSVLKRRNWKHVP
jgi:hypothetical protein